MKTSEKRIVPDVAKQRRQNLTALEKAVDAGVVSDRQRAVRELLGNPLIVAENKMYRLIRAHSDYLREWFAHHADWQLSVTAEAARLRKTPATIDDASRPCRDPKSGAAFSRQGYVYFCLAMAVLIRSDRQTTLGDLCEKLGGQLAGEPRLAEAGILPPLETPGNRRDLVSAVRRLIAWGVLVRVQGDEEKLLRDAEADALYNVNRPVLARLLASTNAPSLVDESATFSARLESTHESVFHKSEESRHRLWRTRLFRRLLDDPVLYYDTLSEDERDYLNRQRSSILDAIEKATGLVREVRLEGIAMADPTGKLTDYKLPEDGTEGHLTLLLAEYLSAKLRDAGAAGDGEKVQLLSVPITELEKFTAEKIDEHKKHWRKNVTDAGQDRILTATVLERLEALSLLCHEMDGECELVIPLPALGRYALVEEIAEKQKPTDTQLGLLF